MTGCASPSSQAVRRGGPSDGGTGAGPIPAGTGNVAGSTTDDGTGTGPDPLAGEPAGAGPAMLIVTLWGATEDPSEVEPPDRPGASAGDVGEGQGESESFLARIDDEA